MGKSEWQGIAGISTSAQGRARYVFINYKAK